MEKWKNVYKLIAYPSGGILSKVLSKSGSGSITLFCMAKGTEISEHTSTRQGLVLVLEGRGTFNLKGEDIAMAPGVAIFMERNAVHWLKAWENTAYLLMLYG